MNGYFLYKSKELKISGLSPLTFLLFFGVTIIAMLYNLVPSGIIGALFVMIALGGILEYIGDSTPILNNYFGGAPLVCIFGTAALVYFKMLPTGTINTISDFMKEGGFLDFYIASLISGSILGIKSEILIKAGLRYIFPLLAGVLTAIVFAALTGVVIGYGWKESILFISMPIMGGGMGAGAIPMAKIFEQFTSMSVREIMSLLIPALALGNVLSIIGAGILDKLGKIRPSLTGNGQLMKGYEVEKEENESPNISMLGTGLFISCGLFIIGIIESSFLNSFFGIEIHSYALMIISVAAAKIFNIFTPQIQKSCNMWYKFVAKNFTPALLVGIGIAYTDLGAVIEAVNLQYIILVTMVVFGAVLGAGFSGMLVGFNFVESALTAGLCMSNMGGTGDVAVLTAARRMELMPFAQISSRLGGAIILILTTLLLPMIGN